MTIWYILCSFGKFFRFWYRVSRKIWQPCPQAQSEEGQERQQTLAPRDNLPSEQAQPKRDQEAQGTDCSSKGP
jgi:hypothetical protein